MKKLYTLIAIALFTTTAFAQTGRIADLVLQSNQVSVSTNIQPLAAGDTLLWIPFLGIYVNPTDQPAFVYQTEDIDGFTFTTTNNFPSPDFAYFYSLDAWDYHPWETVGVDSSFFAAACSWFDNAPQVADNWMEFGPITLPAGSTALLSWFVKTNPTYRDGYEILVNTTGLQFTDFTNPPIFNRNDCYPCTTNSVDTVWAAASVMIPSSFSGQQIFIAFHHDANDMDVIYFDEILMTEQLVSVEELSNTLQFTVSPNPATSTVKIVVSDSKETKEVNITNVLGAVVYTGTFEGVLNSIDVSTLDKGVYFVNVKDGNTIGTQKLVIQ